MMKRFGEWLYTNWLLGLALLGCSVFFFYVCMLRSCKFIVATVEYPAYNSGVYFLSTGEPYFLGYDEEGEFSIFTADMDEVFSSYDVKIAIPEGNIVRIKHKNGAETEVNMLTNEIDESGILL